MQYKSHETNTCLYCYTMLCSVREDTSHSVCKCKRVFSPPTPCCRIAPICMCMGFEASISAKTCCGVFFVLFSYKEALPWIVSTQSYCSLFSGTEGKNLWSCGQFEDTRNFLLEMIEESAENLRVTKEHDDDSIIAMAVNIAYRSKIIEPKWRIFVGRDGLSLTRHFRRNNCDIFQVIFPARCLRQLCCERTNNILRSQPRVIMIISPRLHRERKRSSLQEKRNWGDRRGLSPEPTGHRHSFQARKAWFLRSQFVYIFLETFLLPPMLAFMLQLCCNIVSRWDLLLRFDLVCCQRHEHGQYRAIIHDFSAQVKISHTKRNIFLSKKMLKEIGMKKPRVFFSLCRWPKISFEKMAHFEEPHFFFFALFSTKRKNSLPQLTPVVHTDCRIDCRNSSSISRFLFQGLKTPLQLSTAEQTDENGKFRANQAVMNEAYTSQAKLYESAEKAGSLPAKRSENFLLSIAT